VDGLTWRDYEADLSTISRFACDGSIAERTGTAWPAGLHTQADGRQRPLAVAALEDKIVQRATTALLNAIYEEDFSGSVTGSGRARHARCA